MQKRILLIAIPVVLIAFAILFYLFFYPQVQYTGSSVVRALPQNAPFIIRVNHGASLTAIISNNQLWGAVSQMPQMQKLHQNVLWIDSLKNNNPEGWGVFAGREWFISLVPEGNSGMVPVLMTAVQNKIEVDLFNRMIKTESEHQGFQVFERKYQRASLFEVNNPRNGQRIIAWAIWNGVLICSPKPVLVEDAIRALDHDENEIDPHFEMVLKTAGTQCDINLYVNHQHADKLLSQATADEVKLHLPLLRRFANWTELDISLSEEKLTLSGFSSFENSEQYYSTVWMKQQPSINKLEMVLPQSTAWYLGYSISDLNKLFSDYKAYLSINNANIKRDNQLKKIQNMTGTNPETLFAEMVDQEMAMATIASDEGTDHWGQAWIMKVKSGRNASLLMAKWQNAYIETLRLPAAEWVSEYKIDNTVAYNIYKNPFPELPAALFGTLFDSLHAGYFSVYGNYLLFADTPKTLSTLLLSNVLGETLNGNVDYMKFQTSLASKSNINFFCNTNLALPNAHRLFNPLIAENLKRNDQAWKFRMFGWQLVTSGNMIYNNASLLFSSEMKSKPQTVWKSHLEAASDFKPQFVRNHNDPANREIMVQDNEHNLYLINNVGRVIWKLKLDSRIMSEIFQIDYFKNGKFQYFFNTEKRLHMIDRNGNYVDSYPVNLRSNATNGVNVFDYENNRNYRFFVACTDKRIYAYEANGKLLDGWEAIETDHPVTKRVEYFRSEGKDYLVLTDGMKDYILNRRGEIRVPTTSIYAHSPNNPVYFEDRTANNQPRFITTDTKGNLHYTYLDGSTEVISTKEYPENHFFMAVNLDSDEQLEYVFVAGNQVDIYDHDLTHLLNKQFEHNITHAPNLYHFSRTSKKIGLVAGQAAKIYLLNTDGTLHDGFPLVGSSPFSIGFITENSSNFNLLVGGPDGYIYNYYVE